MTLELVHYDYTAGSDRLHGYLQLLKDELAKYIPHFGALRITNGAHFNDTYHFIGDLVRSMGSQIDFDELANVLWDSREQRPELTMKTLICVEQPGVTFKENPDWHGLTWPGAYALILQTYKNIAWHEAAHLFGAEDHYGNRIERCTEKASCVMQYDPGTKQCFFCSEALKEIASGMSKIPIRPISLRHLTRKRFR